MEEANVMIVTLDRALKEGPAQERQTLTNRCSSPGTEGSGQLGVQETETGSVVTVRAF